MRLTSKAPYAPQQNWLLYLLGMGNRTLWKMCGGHSNMSTEEQTAIISTEL